MKIADVKIGAVYLTRIGPTLAPVRVVAPARFNMGNEVSRFRVQRVGEASPLPKPRTAAALREVPFMVVRMKDQPWEVHVRQTFNAPFPTGPTGLVKFYEVKIPAFPDYAPTDPVMAISAAEAGVLAARAMVAKAVFS